MPMAVLELRVEPQPRRKLWTRAEYEDLYKSGLLDDQRLELVEGELINKMGKNRPHVSGVAMLLHWLMSVFGARLVLQESPINVAPEDNPTNEPEPDLVVLSRDLSAFASDNPGPRDLQLVVEVANITLGFDLKTKAGLYARAGIVEYWVFDTAGRRMIVHRDPREGAYTSVAAYAAEESVAPLAAPESLLRISDLFPA
jgi:Uma2 family endonuclease